MYFLIDGALGTIHRAHSSSVAKGGGVVAPPHPGMSDFSAELSGF